MYSIYADDVCIYHDGSPLESVRAVSPKLTLSDSAAGSLTITIPPTNAGYSTIERLNTEIRVLREGTEIWCGRVISETSDFWKNRKLTCEGELAFLNDTMQPQAEFHHVTPKQFLEAIIAVHNSKVEERKQFTVGNVTVTDPNDSIYRYTNYNTTLDCINDKLINDLGGHIRIRKEMVFDILII